MTEKPEPNLGAVQQTLFITLAGRARETRRRHPILRDPRAVEIVNSVDFDVAKYGSGWGGNVTVLRTAVFDTWVSAFIAEHPDGTVVEVGSGLNTRFERVDNGRVHWIDLDLPDVIELRRGLFADTDRRRMVAASVVDDRWMTVVERSPAPYFFAAEGVLVYLPDAPEVIRRIADRFSGALLAFDTYTHRMLERQHQMAEKKGMEARWAWSCDDPSALESLGIRVIESAAVTRPPPGLQARLPLAYRCLLPIAHRFIGDVAAVTLYRCLERPGP